MALVCLIISAIFVYFFSYSTSPWVLRYFGGDSAQFQTIGKAWVSGKIPYRDMFDHKGPVIFFIDMLGYRITGDAVGIMIIQIVFLSVSCWFLYRIIRQAAGDRRHTIIPLLLILIVLERVYGGGNYTEEYCLPFICMSLYFQANYFTMLDNDRTADRRHHPLWALIYGLSFGVCAMSKLTNGVSICTGVLIIFLVLAADGQWGNILKNVLGFLAGLAVAVVPFAVYFAANGSFFEFIYATFLYNFEYQQHMSSWLFSGTTPHVYFLRFLIWGFPFYTIFVTAFLAGRGKRKLIASYCVLTGLLEAYLYLSGALYSQYYLIAVPQMALLFHELLLLKTGQRTRNVIKALLICGICAFCCLRAVPLLRIHDRYRQRSEVYETLLDEIPEDERDSFVAWGNNELKEVYLLYDRMPCYKYYAIQPWHAGFSERIKEDIYNTFQSGDARWILADTKSTGMIRDILDTDYEKVDSAGDYALYRRRRE